MLRKTTICIILMLLAIGHGQVMVSGARAVPKVLGYQGYLTDTLGSPIDDSLDMTFRILDAVTGGIELWNENQINVPVEQGNFSLLLGSVNNIPDTVFTQGTDRWLEMIIEGTDTLQPRTRIASAAYAYIATYSDTADYAKNAATDNDWIRGTPDSVLFTANCLGIARGDANNMLYGDSVHTHTNLGVACTTGTSGQDRYNCTVSGGKGNTASHFYATVAGGVENTASGYCATVSGGQNNKADLFASYSTVGGGEGNTVSSAGATVGGGLYNIAGNGATVAGGEYNTASGHQATVAGGDSNTASSYYATVGGGYVNDAGDDCATVAGGWNNDASGYLATVGGGYGNDASGYGATVGGGKTNTASDDYATVGGGSANAASGPHTTVSGGWNNTASFYYATVGGGRYDTVNAVYGGVAAGYSNLAGDAPIDSAVFVGGGYDNSATAKYATVGGGRENSSDSAYTTVAGGRWNSASRQTATVAGGAYNTASGFGAVVGGGGLNTASGDDATVGGGQVNTASGGITTVGGGSYNVASMSGATVGGGQDNHCDSAFATVAGGLGNYASNYCATVGGGYYCESNGEYSFTVGYKSIVPSSYSNSAAFNGQTATAGGQTRVGMISKASGSFTIDHPTEPLDRILNHYFVESPEMVLIYRGAAIIGSDGRAEVHLPEYFDALNKNPMVQLTGVGTPDVVYVAEKVTGNRFVIGGKPGTEVYWTVTAERKDQSAEITRILMPVEQQKEGDLVGHSLDDDFLAATMHQLERMGQSGKFTFRTAEGQEKYEDSRRRPMENK